VSQNGISMSEENLSMVYEQPGIRGEKRQSLTDNQKALLWSLYERQQYNHIVASGLSANKLRRAYTDLTRKGMLEDGKVTEKGKSYASRLRKV
jgi:hypothetical protein